MKIVLHINSDVTSGEARAILLEMFRQHIIDKSTENVSPLRYVDKMEVDPR